MSGEGEIPLEAVRPRAAEQRRSNEVRVPIGDSLEQAQSKIILETFAATGGDRGRTADILGLDQEELGQRLLELLDKEPEPEAVA
jgi:DNA-binding NtrC family response regulator